MALSVYLSVLHSTPKMFQDSLGLLMPSCFLLGSRAQKGMAEMCCALAYHSSGLHLLKNKVKYGG